MIKINSHVTEKDYVDFNDFILLKSPYGKKQTKTFKAFLIITFCCIGILHAIVNSFELMSIFFCFVYVFLGVGLSFGYVPFAKWLNRKTIQDLNKKGKPCYSADSTFEFDEESFTETTADGQSTVKYGAIEGVSVVNGKIIYIHLNKMLAYILTETAFESSHQFDELVKFISTKIKNVSFY